MTVHGPAQALTWHLDLFDRIRRASATTTEDGIMTHALGNAQFMQAAKLMTSINGAILRDGQTIAVQQDDESKLLTQENLAQTHSHIRREAELLDRAETHYVSAGVVSAVAAAAEMAEPEMLYPTDLPAREMLLVFEEPLVLDDLDPDTGLQRTDLGLPVVAMNVADAEVGTRTGEDGAMEVNDGIIVTLYTDEASFRQHYLADYANVFPDRTDDVRSMDDSIAVLGKWCVDVTAWGYGVPWTQVEFDPENPPDIGEILGSMAFVRRFLLAYFRWTWQRILVPHQHVPNRAERRRWHRTFNDEPNIKVLKLRREVEQRTGDDEGAGFIDAKGYSWIVRGHWRRQWYKSMGPARNEDGSFNHDSHRLVWIEPHLAGDGPLKVGHRVTAAVR